MTQQLLAFLFGFVISHVLADGNVLLTNLEPDEAKQILDQQDQSLRYAPKIDTNVPAVRFLGNEPHHVLEDIYLARQYHGQDGLGAYLYGYSVPDISKNEKKERSGDLQGQYSYINNQGKEIRVRYWDDGTGFHQEDNLAEILPQQVEDSPEVKAAKEKFFRRWQQEAERNSKGLEDPYQQPPTKFQVSFQPGQTPSSALIHSSGYKFQKNPGSFGGFASGPQPGSYGSNIQAFRTGRNSNNVDPNSIDYSGQYTENRPTYALRPNPDGSANPRQANPDEDEEKYPPKGFFYAFDYPVGIIVNKGDVVKRETLESAYAQGKEYLDKLIGGESSVKRKYGK